MTPVSSFTVTPNFLVIQFNDTSINLPTSWSWNFGDGSPLVTTQSPQHVYTTAGTYTVQLTATNPSGSSSLSRQIVISDTPILPVSLRDFIKLKLPTGAVIDPQLIEAYIAEWQIIISPLVTPPISVNNIFSELAYTPLANVLIADLVTYYILLDIQTQLMAGPNSKGPLKAITTGPASSEWYDKIEYLKTFFIKSGPLEQLRQQICQIAGILRISLSMCPPLPKPIILPQISKNSCHLSYSNPYLPLFFTI